MYYCCKWSSASEKVAQAVSNKYMPGKTLPLASQQSAAVYIHISAVLTSTLTAVYYAAYLGATTCTNSQNVFWHTRDLVHATRTASSASSHFLTADTSPPSLPEPVIVLLYRRRHIIHLHQEKTGRSKREKKTKIESVHDVVMINTREDYFISSGTHLLPPKRRQCPFSTSLQRTGPTCFDGPFFCRTHRHRHTDID